jgi:carbon storage regulator
MLVLTRKLGEKVITSNGIIVTVVEIDRGKIRLGFEGPSDVSIDREEVHERKKAEHNAPPDEKASS